MDSFTIANRNMRAKTVADGLSTILKTKAFLNTYEYGRQVTFGENPNRWYFQGNLDFRAFVAALYQPKVERVPHAIDRSKKRPSHGRV